MSRAPNPSNSLEQWLAELSRLRLNWKGSLVSLLLIPLAILVIWGVMSCSYTVQPEGQAVVKRFGRVVAVKQPGLHFKLPFGIETQTFVPTARILKHEFGFRSEGESFESRTDYAKSSSHQEESLMLTGDLKVVDVEWVVQYRVDDPDKYLHNLRDTDKAIRDSAEAVMRRIVGNSLGSDVLTVKRVQISTLAKQELQTILDAFDMGVTVGTVELQDVTPPDPVKPAFNEVNQAEQEKERMINEAEKRRNQMVPRTRGEAKQLLESAEGYRAQRVNRATGEASRFQAIVQEYRQSPEVTRQRMQLEMFDEVFPNLGRIVVVEGGSMGPLPLLNLDSPGGPAEPRATAPRPAPTRFTPPRFSSPTSSIPSGTPRP